MNEILKTIKSRRSVRAYTEQQISQEDLSTILEAATYAPSGMNYQTWHFTAIQDAAILEELNEKIKGAFAKSDEPRLQERGHSRTYCCYYHAPTLVIVSNEPTVVGKHGLCLRHAEYLPVCQVSWYRLLLDKPVGANL